MNRDKTTHVAIAIFIVCLLGSAGAETVTLKNGHTISAEIIKQDNRIVILDLGYDLLRIPRSQIESIEETTTEDQKTETASEVAEPVVGETAGFYRTADLAPTTIEKNVVRFGEAVVMIRTPNGSGSGFLINADGYLITNYHVIRQETLIKAIVFHKTDNGFDQKQYSKVKIVAFNPYVDLALLKIEEAQREFGHVFLGSMDRVNVGETVFAIGNPLGLTRTVSQGIVSTTNRNGEGQLYVQTTADIAPGNSGGPLFSLSGEVIGVTSRRVLHFGGLGFAIPVDVVKRFVKNWDAFAFREDNPNTGFRYLQPNGRANPGAPPKAKLPTLP